MLDPLHNRLLPSGQYQDLQVLRRIRQFAIGEHFQPSSSLLNQQHEGYLIADEMADADIKASTRFATSLLQYQDAKQHRLDQQQAQLDTRTIDQLIDRYQIYQQWPTWYDHRLAQVGANAYRRYPFLLVWLLRNVALMAGYSVPALSLPLLYTKALTEKALPRLMRTYQFILAVSEPDALSIGGAGWRQCIQVRQIHAQVRHQLVQEGWDQHYWGVPLNQTDMIATHLQFSLLIMRGYQILGARLSTEEAQGILHLWQLASYWLGVDIQRIPHNETQAWQWLYTYLATQRLDFETGRPLAQALHDLPTQLMGEDNRRAQWVEAVNASVTRVFVGDDIGDGLQLPKPRWRYAVLASAPVLLGTEWASERCALVAKGTHKLRQRRQYLLEWWLREHAT